MLLHPENALTNFQAPQPLMSAKLAQLLLARRAICQWWPLHHQAAAFAACCANVTTGALPVMKLRLNRTYSVLLTTQLVHYRVTSGLLG